MPRLWILRALLLICLFVDASAFAAGDVLVGFIARTPRLDYVRDAADPTREGWPAPGQTVSWDAHLVSSFATDLPSVSYRWLLDGAEVARGTIAIPPNGSVVASLPWRWSFVRHELTFQIDPDGVLAEDEKGNDVLSVFTDALSVGFYVEKAYYDLFRKSQHLLAGAHSNSFEDWAQRQIRRFNEMARSAVYAETPEGVLDRWRIDEIVVVPDGALPLVPLPNEGQFQGQPNGNTEPNSDDRSVDLVWGFRAFEVPYFTDLTTADESNPFYLNGTLIHELGHARYLVDVYGWNVRNGAEGDRIDITENGAPVFGSALMPSSGVYAHFTSEKGLMNQTYGFIDRYSAIAMNLVAGRRAVRGNYNEPENIGSFLNDLPAENRLTIRHADGALAKDADVWIYQGTGGLPYYFSRIFDDVPDAKLRTDSSGQVLVGRCPFSADGRVVHTYGLSNAAAIVRVSDASGVAYGFLESLDFNLAYWRGETAFADHELALGSPPCFRNAPALLSPLFESDVPSPATLSWRSVPGSSGYEVWASENGGPALRLASVDASITRYAAALSGHVAWWVVAAVPGCASVRSGLGFFDAGPAPPDASASFFVPVVLSIHGAAGSFYTSELTVTNRGSTTARVVYRYADSAGGAGEARGEIAAGRQVVIEDAIAFLASKGVVAPGERVGTLQVVLEGLSDPGAAAVTVRTSSPVAGGRAGLAYGGVRRGALLQSASAICGLRNDANDRANAAVQNAGTGPISLKLTAVSAGGLETTLAEPKLAPGAFFQLSGALAALPPGASAWLRVERNSGTAPFFAYGVLNDAVTSDGSFAPAFPIASASGPAWTLPVAVETSVFSTELVVANLASRKRTIRVTLVPSGGAASASLDLALLPDEQLLVPDLVARLRAANPAALGESGSPVVGAVFLSDTGGDDGPLLAAARVSSPGAGGRLGLFELAAPRGAAAGDDAWLYGLRQDAENRTNVAFVSTGDGDGSTDVFDADVYDGDSGLLVRSVAGVAAVPPRGYAQIDAFLSHVAPGVSNAYVQVRRTSGGNPFLAYAVVNDGAAPGQRSGDGAFVPAVP
jgi:hypothetical protein